MPCNIDRAPVQAQEATVPVREDQAAVQSFEMPGTSSSEIIVTARKRAESAIDVPVVMTVITQDTIERAAITDLTDVARFAPGLQTGEAVLSTGTQISIRGYGTSASDPGVDQSVALNVDGMTFTQGLAFQSALFDLAQIEVLKGPQSLFFGKSSPGGVIAIRTADPGNRLEVMARAGYEFEAKEYRGELVVSTPITDAFGIRLAGQVWDREGFFRNRATALPGTGARDPKDRLGGGDGHQLRATALFEPSAAFDARLKFNYVYDYNEYPGTLQLASCPDGNAPRPGHPFPPTINPNDDCELDRDVYLVGLSEAGFPILAASGQPIFSERNQIYESLELNYRPTPDLTLTSVSGYYQVDNDLVGFNAYQTGFSGPTLGIQSFYDREEFQQELRLNSDFQRPFNFTVGGFYQLADVVVRQETHANQQLTPARPVFLAGTIHNLSIESISAFAQVRFNPVPELELAAGGRYAHETRGDDVFNAINGNPIVIAVPEFTSNTFSPELTVSYQPSDDLTLFGSYKKGYKAGSYTLTRVPPGRAENSFGDEKIEGGEVGLKSRLMDSQLSLNAAAYYYVITGLQAGVSEADSISGSDLPIARTLNAGGGRSYGLDFEASYSPEGVAGLNLYALVNWNKTKFTEFDNVPCYGGQTVALGCDQQFNPNTGLFTAQDVAGTPFVRAPEWQASFGAAYDRPLSSGWSLRLANENQFSSSYRTNIGLRDDLIRGKHLRIGGSIALTSPDEEWELALIGKNLTNKITTGYCNFSNFGNSSAANQITGGTTSGPDGVDELGCSAERGRAILLRATFRPFN